jgi:hypothetical protein
MWKLVFSTETNRGTGCNREPGVGEFSRDLAPSECVWFNVYPERYQWNGTGIEEIEGWDTAINLQKAKDAIAAERYTREISDLDYKGTFFFMDREARTTLEQTMDKIRRGVIPNSPYKCRNGWTTLTPANIEEIELAGVQHVLNAFMWEMAELQKLA